MTSIRVRLLRAPTSASPIISEQPRLAIWTVFRANLATAGFPHDPNPASQRVWYPFAFSKGWKTLAI